MRSHKIMAALAATAVVAVGLAAADTATTKKTTPPAKKSTTSSAKKAPATTKKGVSSSSKKRRPVATASRSTRQTQPTPERYKQIQQALVSKGYLHGEPTGTWNQESIEAMRKFQADQKLDSTGKIDSLSLIALGLGPKHETATAQPPQPVTPGTN